MDHLEEAKVNIGWYDNYGEGGKYARSQSAIAHALIAIAEQLEIIAKADKEISIDEISIKSLSFPKEDK